MISQAGSTEYSCRTANIWHQKARHVCDRVLCFTHLISKDPVTPIATLELRGPCDTTLLMTCWQSESPDRLTLVTPIVEQPQVLI